MRPVRIVTVRAVRSSCPATSERYTGLMPVVRTFSEAVFACHSAACRPPGSGGTGGSDDGPGGKDDGSVTRSGPDKTGKFTYTVTLPGGKTVQKKAKATYTHAVIIQRIETGEWSLRGMAGSTTLAIKLTGLNEHHATQWRTRMVKVVDG